MQAYAQTQGIIFEGDCDLSAYRLRYEKVPHVVILGLAPAPEIDARLQQVLAPGQSSDLPSEIVQTLNNSRSQAKRLGPWVEGHYRPGKTM